jgi:hypothetical protein
MCEKNDNPKSDTPTAETTEGGAGAATAVVAVLGLVVGTLAGGPALGIVFAVIWGGHAAAWEASRHEVTSHDVS